MDYIYFSDVELVSGCTEGLEEIGEERGVEPDFFPLMTVKAYRTPETWEDDEIHEVHERSEQLFEANGWLILTELMNERGEESFWCCDDFSADLGYVWASLVKHQIIDEDGYSCTSNLLCNIFYIDSFDISKDSTKEQLAETLRQLLYLANMDIIDGNVLDKESDYDNRVFFEDICPDATDKDNFDRHKIIPGILAFYTEDKNERDLLLSAGWQKCGDKLLYYEKQAFDEY